MWEQIQANKRRSAVLIALIALVLGVLGYLLGVSLLGPDGGWLGVGIALFIWSVQWMIYLWSANSFVLRGSNARQISNSDSPRLFHIIEEMRIASGLSFMPKIYLIDDPSPNAFAIGRKPQDSALAVTSGLMYRMNRDELQGVIAHEIGHLKNQDVKFMMLAAVFLGSIVIIAEVITRSFYYSGRHRRRAHSRDGGGQGLVMVLALVFAILAPLMAQLLYFACSRKREYLADASAAQFTRYPEGLASALEKISAAATPVAFASKATAPMFIINPLQSFLRQEKGSLFATHPPTSSRIRILRSMAGASFNDYERAFQTNTKKPLIGKRSLASSTQQAKRKPSADGPIETAHQVHRLIYDSAGYQAIQCNCGLRLAIPPSYENNVLHCIRCGNAHQVK